MKKKKIHYVNTTCHVKVQLMFYGIKVSDDISDALQDLMPFVQFK